MQMSLQRRKAALPLGLAAFLLCPVLFGCTAIETRPVKQMAYAEAAVQGATLANAETNPDKMAVFQLAKDSLARARSFYRLKNFRECRKLAVRARRLAEEAEWKALRGNSPSKETVKEPESVEK